MKIPELLLQIDEISIKRGKEALKKKYDLIKSALDYFKTSAKYNPDEMVELFKRVHWLGYEIGHNKTTEIFANDYHKPLVMYSIEIIRSLSKPDKRMSKPFKDALIYEYDPKKKKELEQEISEIEKQS